MWAETTTSGDRRRGGGRGTGIGVNEEEDAALASASVRRRTRGDEQAEGHRAGEEAGRRTQAAGPTTGASGILAVQTRSTEEGTGGADRRVGDDDGCEAAAADQGGENG